MQMLRLPLILFICSGYMSPEYVVFGQFSTKSDVFSFGVILLEIVSGRKNCDSYQKHPSQNMIGHVSNKEPLSFTICIHSTSLYK